MKTQIKWIIIILALIFTVGIIIFTITNKTEKETSPINTATTKTIAIFVDEEPNNPNNLKEIKIATVAVGISDGGLILNTIVNDNQSITPLNKAIIEIENRPALKLNIENEEMIDGQKALVMKEIAVLKTDPEYIYAIRETLAIEFGFKAEIEK